MSKRKQKENIFKIDIIVNRLRVFLTAALMIIIFYPPYLQGLFFEKHVLPTQIFVFIIFIVFLVYKWTKNDYTFFRTPVEYVSLGFVIVYLISIFVAVHTRSAIIEWLKYCMYFAVFYMVSDLADNMKTKLIFLWTIVVSAAGVSIIGLDAALGGNIVSILNKFFKALGVQGDLFFGLFVDNRIQSTLQYPNALASYLMAVFFLTIGLLIVYNKWWHKIILASLAFVLFSTFILTKSRGAQLLFPVVVIVLFLVAPKGNRIKVVTHVLLLAISSGIISLFLPYYLSSETLNKKALLLLLTGLFMAILISFVVKFIGDILQEINWRIYIVVISTIIITCAMGVNFLVNQSVPMELSLERSNEDKFVSIAKDVSLEPNVNYILRFEAEGNMIEEKPYAFFVRIFNKDISDILFFERKQLVWESFPKTNGFEEFDIPFNTNEETQLINIDFSIYFSGTSVKIRNVSIIDAATGKIVKNIILKNKYNLDNIISRFQYIWLQQSLVSRAIFYKDGFTIFKNIWFLGAGGGSWNYLYRQYQSYNYASSQAHNYPLQLGIETGVLGITVLIALVIMLIIYFIKYYKKTKGDLLSASIITAIAALFMHSIIDFDFSEGSMLLLFWTLIALFNRELIDRLAIKDMRLLNKRMNLKTNKYAIILKSKSAIFIGIFISVMALYFSISFSLASSFAKQSFESLQNNDIETAIKLMEKAINFDSYNEMYVLGYNPLPNRPDIKAGLADILFIKNEKYRIAQENGEDISSTDLNLFQEQISKVALYIKDIEKKSKNNFGLTINLASYCFKTGEIDKGISYLNLAISYFPFEPSLWYSKVDVYYQLMKEYFNNEDYEKAMEYLLKGLNVIDEAKNVNNRNMNPFVFNDSTVKLLETMKFMQDNWKTDEIYDVNEIEFYSIFDLDINLDGIPDQWKINNKELIKVSIEDDDMLIQASGKDYLYTWYPINLQRGKIYRIEVKLKDPIKYISYYIYGVTPESLPLTLDDGKYMAEFVVENELSNNSNQLRIYVEDNCIIENILIKEINY